MVKPYLPTIRVTIQREFDGDVTNVRNVAMSFSSIEADRFEDALELLIDGGKSRAYRPAVETSPAPKCVHTANQNTTLVREGDVIRCSVCKEDWLNLATLNTTAKRCKACGAVGEPGSPDYCSLECYEESH